MRFAKLLPPALLALSACNAPPIEKPGEAPAQVTPDTFEQSLNNKADILFMIDNSQSMDPMQASLIQYFPNFMQPLKDLSSKPDLHIGVVTSDLGAGNFNNVPGCKIGGDQGMLQNTPKLTQPGQACTTAELNTATDRFLVYSPKSDGTVATNFSGDIADAFACYAAVGANGCGFESPLGSLKAALDGCAASGCKQQTNVNFLRSDAYLAIIILTNEDDSSFNQDCTLWDPSQNSNSSQLGCLTSYRQVEFGIMCGCSDPTNPSTCQPLGRAQGPRQSCIPASFDSNPQHQEVPVEDFASFFKGLKPQDPRFVYVSAITGPPAPVAVGLDSNGCPTMQPSCTGGSGTNSWSATPGIRTAKFIDQFDSDRASFISICQTDLKAAMEQIATELAKVLGQQCLSAPLKDKGGGGGALQPDCEVQDRTTVDAAANSYTYADIPPCDPVVCDPNTAPNHDCKCQTHTLPANSPGCWYVWSDSTSCPMVPSGGAASATSVGSGYQLRIDRGIDAACNNPPAPANTAAVVQCSSCIANPKANSYDCSPGCSQYWPNCCPTATSGCFQ